jgi:hypothetical protein
VLDDGRRALRHIGESRAGRRGRNARQIDVVLDRERHAVQRQAVDVATVEGGEVGFQFFDTEQVDEQVIVRVQRRGFVSQAQQQLPGVVLPSR